MTLALLPSATTEKMTTILTVGVTIYFEHLRNLYQTAYR